VCFFGQDALPLVGETSLDYVIDTRLATVAASSARVDTDSF
jgi:hypothetical protein